MVAYKIYNILFYESYKNKLNFKVVIYCVNGITH